MPPKSLIVIGGGPGGYAAALEAAGRSCEVTLIEQDRVGGTCLNRGCIPSKFFLSQAKLLSATARTAEMGPLVLRKEEVVAVVRNRMEQALRSAKVRRVSGQARLLSAHRVEARQPDHTQTPYEAEALVLATGSLPVKPKNFPEHPAVLDSTGFLNLDFLPAHLVVIGGGYIGCELACAAQGFGSKVTLIEKESRLLPTQPEFEAAAGVLQRSFQKRGMTVRTGTQIKGVEVLEDRRFRLETSKGEKFEANAILLAIGRRPNLEGLDIEKAGLSMLDGRLRVNRYMQTHIPSVYAIGDLVSPLPLAHVATREAEVAIAHLWGDDRAIDYAAMPRCVYAWPEVAAVGLSEQQAQEAGYSTRLDRYHFEANAKALVEQEAEGFWLIVSEAGTRKILGGQIIGPHATELIHLISLAIKGGLRVDDIAEIVFAHPSLSEGFAELARRSLQNSLPPLRGKVKDGGTDS